MLCSGRSPSRLLPPGSREGPRGSQVSRNPWRAHANRFGRRLQWLDAFGALIANTDRHPYNVVFVADEGGLRLAPAFDQTSALYSPADDGQVPPRGFAPPHATADTLEVWDDARSAARDFWQQAADDARVSDAVRRIASANSGALRT